MPDYIVFTKQGDAPLKGVPHEFISAATGPEAVARVANRTKLDADQEYAFLDLSGAETVPVESAVAYTITDSKGTVTLTKADIVAIEEQIKADEAAVAQAEADRLEAERAALPEAVPTPSDVELP